MKKTHGQKTKERILKAAVKLWPDVTLEAVAKAANIKSHQAVLYHFPNGTLRDAVAEYAVKTENSAVIVQLIATDHAAVRSMSPSERNKHFSAIRQTLKSRS